MIISHTLKLIFVKTKKVGGTSFEIALSRFCGEDCIITPITPQDEQLRRELGFRGAQNYRQADRKGHGDPDHINSKIRGDFENHDSSEKISRQIAPEIFRGYLKISIHRNPLDFLISQYFFRMGGYGGQPAIPFNQWVRENSANVLSNNAIAPRTGEYACDIILSYEDMQHELEQVPLLPPEFAKVFRSINAKGSFRDPRSRDSRQFFRDNGFTDAEMAELFVLADGRVEPARG